VDLVSVASKVGKFTAGGRERGAFIGRSSGGQLSRVL
jgi:hypothetical protein